MYYNSSIIKKNDIEQRCLEKYLAKNHDLSWAAVSKIMIIIMILIIILIIIY